MVSSDRDNRRVKIHIDLAAMRHNLNRAVLAAPNKKIFSVVKSDAYGHGLKKVVPALHQCDGYAVSNVDEGLAVRSHEALKPVLVLQGFQSTADLQDCVCLLYTSPSPRDGLLSRMPSSA